MNMRRGKDAALRCAIYGSALITFGILMAILGFVLYKGLPGINLKFLTNMWDSKTTIVSAKFERLDGDSNGSTDSKIDNTAADSEVSSAVIQSTGVVPSLGITVAEDEQGHIYIQNMTKDSALKAAVNLKNNSYPVKNGDIIIKAGDKELKGLSAEHAAAYLNEQTGTLSFKILREGGGILPMLVSTLYMVVLSLAIAAPIGILTALYLNEYAKKGRTLYLIRFAIQTLAGIPSIIYGLFGMLVFVQKLKMQYSLLAGSLTLSILLLPAIITSTEEALKAIPKGYRESSLGLGATKLQTNFKIVLPSAMPGILAAILLSVGRIVGESAALLWTAGTIAQIPSALIGAQAGAATLTTKLYWILKETGDMSAACSIAVVLIALIFVLNQGSKLIMMHYLNRSGNRS